MREDVAAYPEMMRMSHKYFKRKAIEPELHVRLWEATK